MTLNSTIQPGMQPRRRLRQWTNQWTRQHGAWLLMCMAAFILSSCGGRVPDMTDIPNISELAALSEQFPLGDMPTIPPEMLELTANFDEYIKEYREKYDVYPRPAVTTLGVAEAYLREYQPGPLPRVFQTTILYDRNGTKLAELVEEGYRTWIPLDRVSPYLIDAVIATEDATFYLNPGFDAKRVIGAMMQNAEAGEVVSGASTITMQLARQLFFTPEERFEQSMDRKAFEALLSQDLTNLYSKDELLEMYLNLVHFGQQAYGIEAASNLYFGKSAADLSLAEATLLAGVPQKPADYDLFANFDGVRSRQGVVLSLMVRHGFLSEAEAQAVFNTPVVLNPNTEKPPVLAPHFVQYVTDDINAQLDGMDVRRTGMRIFTTLDLRMQNLAQQIVAEQVAELQPTFDLSNAALVALKPGTAEILTMVGSADFYNPAISGQVNVAVRQRQPGSAIKPILYALAMNDLKISPATIIWDTQTRYRVSDTENYSPINYDREFHGPVTVRSALANSYNVPAVKLLDAVGIPRMLEGARAMGIVSLNREESWYGLSLTLGGGEVTLLDLTTAFHTLANSGRYQRPQAVLFTTGGPDGRNIVMDTRDQPQIITPQAAYLVTHIMSDNEARAPEFGSDSSLFLSKPAAAKTGTTTDYRDNWTEGYTRYLVTGVWAGNSDGRPMRSASGVTGAAPIWNAFMEAVLADPALLAVLGAPADPAAWEFQPPADVVTLPIACPTGIGCRETEVFDRKWLDLMDEAGPLGDSVAVASMRSVYVNGGTVGACSAEEGESRQLVRMPVGLTNGLPVAVEPGPTVGGALAALAPQPNLVPPLPNQENGPLAPINATTAISRSLSPLPLANALNIGELDMENPFVQEMVRRVRDEQNAALSWSRRVGSALYLGPCDQVETVARAVFGERVTVNVQGYTRQVADSEEAREREALDRREELDRREQEVAVVVANNAAPPAANASSSYSPVGVAHDANCGGNYVMGSVANSGGQAVAGVRVTYSDSAGNYSEQVTSSAAQGYGSFRFPINTSGALNIQISVGGQSASVPHLQGGASDQGCHYVIWRGVD